MNWRLLPVLSAVMVLAGSPQQASAAPINDADLSRVIIDRVEVVGVTAFPNTAIEESLEVEPGDKADRVRILRSVQNLITLYHTHGYESAGLKTNLFRKKIKSREEIVLELNVTEGDPTRMESIRFVPEGMNAKGSDRVWRKIQSQLSEKISIVPGEIFDQEKISAAKHTLLDLLAAEEFVGARVDDIRISSVPPPTQADVIAVAKNQAVARWVAVEFHVELGDRVSFGFRGNKFFSQTQLVTLEEEQRNLGFGRDYMAAIQKRIFAAYQAEGFARAKIEIYPSEDSHRQERHVTYVIEEGPRVRIASIQFDGNTAFSRVELLKKYYEKASGIVQHGYFVEKDIQSAAEVLIDWIKSQGYLAAKLVTVNAHVADRAYGSNRGAFEDITIYVYEGDQTLIQAIDLTGVKEFTPSEIDQLIGIKEGGPLDLFSFGRGLESLKQAYRNRGYLGMKINNEGTDHVVLYSSENRLAEVHLDLNEGPQFRTSQIIVEGLQLTKEIVVRRELQFRVGEVLREYELYETEARLRRLGIFSVVTLRAEDDPAKPGYKTVRISVQEAIPGVVAGGPGFRNDLGVRLFGQISYDNLWGLDHTVSLNANVNRRFENYRFAEYGTQLSYLYPYFVGDMTFRPSLTLSGTEYIQFDATDVTLALTFEKKLSKHLTTLLTYSLERVNQFNVAESTDSGILRIGSLTPAIRLDLRDNPLSPTSGYFSFLSFDFASPWLGSQGPNLDSTLDHPSTAFNADQPEPIQPITQGDASVGYYRLQWRNDFYMPVFPESILFLSFRTGYERNNEHYGFIPLIKQFALGGTGSLRGFQEQALNFQNLEVRGTLTYVNYRAQLDLPFTGALKFGPFVDAANLNTDHFSFGGLLYGIGIGFHYLSPVGPINLDYGFNPSPRAAIPTIPGSNGSPAIPGRPADDTSRIYFSVGVI